MDFAKKFLSLRKAAGLSQEEAADKLGVSRQAISRWEQGTALPDAFNLSVICRVFNVSADSLIGDLAAPPSEDDAANEGSGDAACNACLAAEEQFSAAKERRGHTLFLVCKYIHFAALALEGAGIVCFVCSQVAAFWVLFGIGVLISLCAIIVAESLLGTMEKGVRGRCRRDYYKFSVWVFTPLPLIVAVISVCWLSMSDSGQTMPVFLIALCCLAVYVFACAVITSLLKD